LTYYDAVDMNQKQQVCEDYCNLNRPHGSVAGKAPYEVLNEKLTAGQLVSSEV